MHYLLLPSFLLTHEIYMNEERYELLMAMTRVDGVMSVGIDHF